MDAAGGRLEMGGFKESLPRRKDWKEGDTQLGMFYRGPTGATMYITVNAASDKEMQAAVKLIYEMTTAAAIRNKLI